MESDTRYLDRMVLESVSSDYVPFETIVKRVADSLSDNSTSGIADQIQRSLLASIASRHVGAYSLHADPPFISPVDASANTVERYWFYITESGEYLLKQMLKSDDLSSSPDQPKTN